MPYLPLGALSALGYNTAGVGDPNTNQLRGAMRMDLTNKGQAQAAQIMQAQALADAMRRRQMQGQGQGPASAPAASPIPVDQTALSRMPLNPMGMTPLDQRTRYSSYPPVVIGAPLEGIK